MSPGLVFIVILLAFVGYTLLRSRGDTTSEQAHQLVKDGALLVDVRTAGEFAAGHVPGALNIPVDEVERRVSEFGPKERPVVLYCRSGNRSGRAASMLRASGYRDVHNLGAMSRW